MELSAGLVCCRLAMGRGGSGRSRDLRSDALSGAIGWIKRIASAFGFVASAADCEATEQEGCEVSLDGRGASVIRLD